MDGRMDGRTDGWTDGWMPGQTDGQTGRQTDRLEGRQSEGHGGSSTLSEEGDGVLKISPTGHSPELSGAQRAVAAGAVPGQRGSPCC